MLHVDATDYQRFAAEYARLPGQIKAKAFARAMRRVNTLVRTQVIRRSAERIDLPQKHIRPVYTMLSTGSDTLEHVVRSGWIPLYKLGARQTARGVTVRGRGSIASAFITEMQSGHAGVFMRTSAARLPIRELFGPNPASDIGNNPEVFEKVLVRVAETKLGERVLHELSRILPK